MLLLSSPSAWSKLNKRMPTWVNKHRKNSIPLSLPTEFESSSVMTWTHRRNSFFQEEHLSTSELASVQKENNKHQHVASLAGVRRTIDHYHSLVCLWQQVLSQSAARRHQMPYQFKKISFTTLFEI